MSRTIRTVSLIVMLALIAAACSAAPAGTPAASAPSAAPSVAITDAPATEAPASEAPASEAPSEAPASEAPSEAPASEPAASEPAVTASPSPPPAGVEGTLTLWVDEVRAPYMIELGAEFEAATGVPVAVHQLGFGDIRDQLQLRGPAGEGPDVIIGAHDWLGQLVTNGLVEPLDLGAEAESFDEVAVQAFTYEGQLYGVPYASEAIALYYNTELVPEPPATWDELKTIAQELQDEQGLEQAFVLQQGDPYHSYPLLSGHGGYIFARDAEGNYDPTDVGLDSEGGLAYARELDQMVKDGLLRADVNYDTMIQLFTQGETAMFMTGPWQLPAMRETGVPFDVAPIPAMDEEARPFVGVQAFMVSAFAPNKTLAETFLLEYIATDETMAALFEADPRPPTWLPQREQVDDEQVLTFAESASRGDPMPAIPEMSSVWTDWTDAINLIFTQAQDPDQAMRDAAENIRTTIAGE
jgi:maltose-binding protein MalE